MSKTLEIDSGFEYLNYATGDNVVLKVVQANGIMCAGCYFNSTERHCPDEYACGQFARKDKTAVIFKFVENI